MAKRLAESIKRSGGRIRLDTPVLRLSYDSTGAAVGLIILWLLGRRLNHW